MGNTREKILEQARLLYNEYGMANVSQRRIAGDLGISPGNLTYHFPKKNDINEALFFALVNEIDTKIANRQADHPDLNGFFLIYGDIYDAFDRYRFVFLDFVHFMKSSATIANHYRQLQVLRKIQFRAAIDILLEQAVIRPQELAEEYDYLYERIQIFADFFLSAREILGTNDPASNRQRFVEGLRHMLYPYLTEKGREVLAS